MLDNYKRAILNAYGKARMNLKSYAVISYDYTCEHDEPRDDVGFLIIPCDELWHHNKHKNDEIVVWMHSNIIPCWEDYDISEDDYYDYMKRRFPLLVN